MTITTAFDRGDQVFYIKNDKIEHGIIKRIIAHVLANDILTVNYWLEANSPDEEQLFGERQLFASKELVRQSL